MATFSVTGINDLNLAFQKSAEVPDEVKKKILQAMGEQAKKAIEDEGNAKNVRDPESNVHVLENVTINKPKLTDSGGSILITFKGTRKRGNTVTRNAEIAFINEFGKRGVAAKMFIKGGLDKYSEQIFEAGEKAFQSWLDSLFNR